MIEKVNRVSNPLTIVAIFAALAEVAGTVALVSVSPELQKVFVWFVMLFPTALVGLFFITLNFNPQVLYAPSDFQDEDNFLRILAGKRELSLEFESVVRQLESSRDKIVNEALLQLGEKGNAERSKLADAIGEQIRLVRDKVEATRESADELVLDYHPVGLTHSELQSRIVKFLLGRSAASSLADIREASGRPLGTRRAIEKLVKRGIIVVDGEDLDSASFRLAGPPGRVTARAKSPGRQ